MDNRKHCKGCSLYKTYGYNKENCLKCHKNYLESILAKLEADKAELLETIKSDVLEIEKITELGGFITPPMEKRMKRNNQLIQKMEDGK